MFASDLRRVAAAATCALRCTHVASFAPRLHSPSHLKAFFSLAARPHARALQPFRLSDVALSPRASAYFSSFSGSRGGREGASLSAPTVLQGKIAACQSRDEVLALFKSCQGHNIRDMNPFHISVFLTTLKKLGGNPVSADARFIDLVDLTRLRLADANGRGLATIIHCCARLGATLSVDWQAGFWESSEAKMPTFKAQELSNTLWACSELGLTPPQSWRDRFWILSGAKLHGFNAQDFSNTLHACGKLSLEPLQHWIDCFWTASKAKLSGFTSQGLSNTLLACSKLGLMPPQHWRDHFWTESQSKLSGFNAQELSNTFYACSTLYLMPSERWKACFFDSSANKLADFNTQDLSKTLMALAMLEQWSSPILKPIWSALQRSLGASRDACDPNRNLDLDQMYLVFLVADSEQPGMLAFEVPGLLEEAKRWRSTRSKTEVPSSLHKEVHAFLIEVTRGKIPFESNVWCGKSHRIIDMALSHGDRRAAIEIDGPSHFVKTADGKYELDGQTRLRNRLLEGAGWHVISVEAPEKDSAFDRRKLMVDLLACFKRDTM
jgi:hypothetical protein